MRQRISKELIEELNQIKSNLHTLHQFFQEQLSQIPTSDVDLLMLHKQHKVRICLIDPIRTHMEYAFPGDNRSSVSDDCFIGVI